MRPNRIRLRNRLLAATLFAAPVFALAIPPLLAATSVTGAAHARSGGETMSFTYDARGRLIRADQTGGPADGAWTTHEFDDAGNKTRRTRSP
ncbi:MAG: hypothetical protein AAFX09_09550 [Pseudomonadota bacterium]